jgi:methyl coenzyme M reductase subunit D
LTREKAKILNKFERETSIYRLVPNGEEILSTLSLGPGGGGRRKRRRRRSFHVMSLKRMTTTAPSGHHDLM